MPRNKGRRGRYESNEKKPSERKYTSYEDVPLEDVKDTEQEPKNITGKFLKVFLILFLSVVAVLAIMNIEKLTPDNIAHWFQYDLLGKTDGEGYPVAFSGSSLNTQNFDLISNVPVYCSDTTIAVLNQNAGKYQENQHSFASPALRVNGGCGLIYNIDATGYTVIRRDEVTYSGSAADKIYAGDIASNGVYALLTRSDDYLSKLTVYRTDNLEKYEYSFADYYVNTVSLNQDGSRAVLSGVSARNGGLISVLYILDFTQNTYMQKYEADDTFIYDVAFLNNGNAVAVGDHMSFFIDVGSGQKKDIGYRSRTLTGYTLKRDDGLLLSLSVNPDGRACDIVTVNNSGEAAERIQTGEKVYSMDIFHDRIAVLEHGRIVVFNAEGKEEAAAEVNADSRRLCYTDSRTFYVLGKSRISKIGV